MSIAAVVIIVGLRPDPYLTALAQSTTTAAPPQRSIAAGIRTLWHVRAARSGLITIISAHAVMVAIMSMTPVSLAGHGISLGLSGLIISLHIAGMYALSPLLGSATDRYGPRRVILGSLAMLLGAALLAAAAGANQWISLCALILLGIGWSGATVAGADSIVASTALEARVSAQGAADMLMSLFGAAGGVLAGLAVAAVGSSWMSVISAVVIVLALIANARPGTGSRV